VPRRTLIVPRRTINCATPHPALKNASLDLTIAKFYFVTDGQPTSAV
jgi:hypothetical protein